MLPFTEKIISENLSIREFKRTSASDEQMWHRDKENRTVIVLESGGWHFQKDNSLPRLLREGDEIFIPMETWHRVIQGEGVLKVKVIKETLEESEFSYMIAQAAMDGKKEVKIGDKTYPVKMSKDKAKKILDEKDDVVEESDNPHPRQYGAPQGSKRDKQLDATKADLASGDPERIARAYRRREKMEKKARNKPGFKNKPRSDSKSAKKEARMRMTEAELRETIRSILREGLSKKTKATLRKKLRKEDLLPGL